MHRFTFYDQVHTTGMDIKQALSCTAAVTLGEFPYPSCSNYPCRDSTYIIRPDGADLLERQHLDTERVQAELPSSIASS